MLNTYDMTRQFYKLRLDLLELNKFLNEPNSKRLNFNDAGVYAILDGLAQQTGYCYAKNKDIIKLASDSISNTSLNRILNNFIRLGLIRVETNRIPSESLKYQFYNDRKIYIEDFEAVYRRLEKQHKAKQGEEVSNEVEESTNDEQHNREVEEVVIAVADEPDEVLNSEEPEKYNTTELTVIAEEPDEETIPQSEYELSKLEQSVNKYLISRRTAYHLDVNDTNRRLIIAIMHQLEIGGILEEEDYGSIDEFIDIRLLKQSTTCVADYINDELFNLYWNNAKRNPVWVPIEELDASADDETWRLFRRTKERVEQKKQMWEMVPSDN